MASCRTGACCLLHVAMLHGAVAVTPPVPPHEQRSLRLTIIVSTLCLSVSLARTHAHMDAHTDTHPCARTRACAPTRVRPHTHVHANTPVRAHARVQTRMKAHSHTYIHTNTHARARTLDTHTKLDACTHTVGHTCPPHSTDTLISRSHRRCDVAAVVQLLHLTLQSHGNLATVSANDHSLCTTMLQPCDGCATAT